MNKRLRQTIEELVGRFESAREPEKSASALRCWEEARALVDIERAAGEPRLDRVGACLDSLESVVRCWATCGFEASFRLAQALVEVEWSAVEREATNSVSRAA